MEMVNKKFKTYMNGILKWNETINLTAITDESEFIVKHYFDSLICLDFKEYKQAETVIDVGTGAGFPGIPLAIQSPEKKFTLVDSLKKRLKIIDFLCQESNIENVRTVHRRAEELAREKDYRETFDLSVSRAVARLPILAEYCLPFIKVGGYLLAYKGPDWEREVKEGEKAVELLGGELVDVREGKLEEYGIYHNVIVIKKKEKTHLKYPRKPGMPTKNPII